MSFLIRSKCDHRLSDTTPTTRPKYVVNNIQHVVRQHKPFSVSLKSALSLLIVIRNSDLDVNIRSDKQEKTIG